MNFAWFKVSFPEVAIRFSFEVNAPRLYDLNGKALPFGYHGWTGYDTDCWTLHMEGFGYYIELTKFEPSNGHQRGSLSEPVSTHDLALTNKRVHLNERHSCWHNIGVLHDVEA